MLTAVVCSVHAALFWGTAFCSVLSCGFQALPGPDIAHTVFRQELPAAGTGQQPLRVLGVAGDEQLGPDVVHIIFHLAGIGMREIVLGKERDVAEIRVAHHPHKVLVFGVVGADGHTARVEIAGVLVRQ